MSTGALEKFIFVLLLHACTFNKRGHCSLVDRFAIFYLDLISLNHSSSKANFGNVGQRPKATI